MTKIYKDIALKEIKHTLSYHANLIESIISDFKRLEPFLDELLQEKRKSPSNKIDGKLDRTNMKVNLIIDKIQEIHDQILDIDRKTMLTNIFIDKINDYQSLHIDHFYDYYEAKGVSYNNPEYNNPEIGDTSYETPLDNSNTYGYIDVNPESLSNIKERGSDENVRDNHNVVIGSVDYEFTASTFPLTRSKSCIDLTSLAGDVNTKITFN